MSIFSSILNKIFPHDHPAASASGAATPPASPGAAPATPTASGTPTSTPAGTASAEPARPPVTPMPEVDVEAILTQKQQQSGATLNWRTSIVDLLKLLDLDSSLDARKSLAAELHYTGSTDDSASMNIWLHKQVMKKLAENGGKVPADLQD
ncbi:DUF3597 domain-containing protein [Caballeronia sp. LP006]|jgi:hypothetical protein|uniref:DUF3597 domain-containing protein n=1 Tax=unclassified Caballeronia TaxID=2646786 RepID=UPI002029692E|nr:MULTISPECIES: DUF3597 domain-containing protein [unclassified Caballeronia]MDR5775096.1 DUF3597 domain-containing protein [Caballeronia sp. LZ002]MDR5828242.1 DUF3597 domain-containing protein [Caballeronia sp. LP006]MDR5850533.1 DUF3597 domain-containing protein [Caballeronia sp. LZ003]